jgi:hypothetical protein
LSARPNPIVGHLEKRSIAGLIDLTRPASPGPFALQLRPSALSGHATSSTLGTLETVFRNRLAIGRSFLGARPQTALNPGEQPVDLLTDILPHGQEDEIAEVKFMNFLSFASVTRSIASSSSAIRVRPMRSPRSASSRAAPSRAGRA